MDRIQLKPGLRGFPDAIWPAALLLGGVFFAMRAGGVLGPVQWRWLLPLMCVLMVVLPCLLLDVEGRRQIGLQWPARPAFLLIGLLSGALAAGVCFGLGMLLYGASAQNWFVSIANNYRTGIDTAGFSLLQLHLYFTIAACIFSPLGEEIFFRGFLQRALEDRFSRRASTHLEAGLFALAHLCHHGLGISAAGLSFQPVSGAMWALLMFCTAWIFALLRQRSDSLWPAVLAHSAFNATMNSVIFVYLWD